MRFLLDESADARLGPYLLAQGHDVAAIAVDHPAASLADPEVLRIAHREERVLITNDCNFGELAVAERQPHAGIILFRLGPDAPLATKIRRLDDVLTRHAHELDRFLVVTPNAIRIRA